MPSVPARSVITLVHVLKFVIVFLLNEVLIAFYIIINRYTILLNHNDYSSIERILPILSTPWTSATGWRARIRGN
jgi:hypothetical protein